MAKPTDVLRWCNNPTTARTAPPAGLKDVGAAVKAKWPSQYLNYLHGLAGDWITWINARLFDAYTLVTLAVDCLLYGSATDGLEVRNAAGTRLPVRASEAWLGTTGATRLKDGSGELRTTNAADALIPAHFSTIYGTAFRLDDDRYSCIMVPLGACLTNEVGGAKWTRSSGSGATNDLLLSIATGAQAVWHVQIPYGALVSRIVADWQPAAASPTSKLCMKAQAVAALPMANGVDVAGSVAGLDMLSGSGKVEQAASTNRKWAVYTPDQNNTDFENQGQVGGLPDESAVKFVRIEIDGSDDPGGGDMVYGLYVICKHRSVGHLSPAPAITS